MWAAVVEATDTFNGYFAAAIGIATNAGLHSPHSKILVLNANCTLTFKVWQNCRSSRSPPDVYPVSVAE